MIDKLLEGVASNALGSMTEKAGISLDQAKSILPIAKDNLSSGLMEQVTGGNIGGLVSMFQSSGDGLMSNPIVAGIKQNIIQSVMSKVGVPQGVASLAAGAGLQSMIGGLSDKLSGDDGQVTEDSITSQLGAGGLIDGLKGQATDALKDKLGGIGKLFG